MLSLTTLPPSPSTTTRMVSGRCRAGQLREAAKQATEAAFDEAHKRATQSAHADNLLPVLLGLLLLAGLTH
jgi:hypothetical protein